MAPVVQRPLKMRAPHKPRLDVGAQGDLPKSPTVLLLVDVINPMEFAGAADLAAPALVAARATARLKRRLTQAGVLTIYANDNYGRWRSDFRDTLGLHSGRDSRG